MELTTYLSFNGQCLEAFRFYEQCLGAKILFQMTWAESPMAEQTAPEWRDKIMHASLRLDGQSLGGSDSPVGYYRQPQGFHVSISLNDPTEAERLFHVLAEDGAIQMPLASTFWAARFGMLTDRFGTPWMINCSS